MNISEYIQQARARARRRRSPWNLVLIPLVVGGWLALWWVSFRLVWRVHELFYPEHVGRLREFWPRGLGFTAFISSFLMVFGPAVPALVLAMLAANSLLWFVRPAREALEAEGSPHPGIDFKTTQRSLMRWGAVVLFAGVMLALLGAGTLHALR